MLNRARLAMLDSERYSTVAGAPRLGFRPAFLDFETMRIHPARFADGSPAPFHSLDGLPDEVVADRGSSGRVVHAKATLVPGFERNGFFYTMSAAARACAEWPAHG